MSNMHPEPINGYGFSRYCFPLLDYIVLDAYYHTSTSIYSHVHMDSLKYSRLLEYMSLDA